VREKRREEKRRKEKSVLLGEENGENGNINKGKGV